MSPRASSSAPRTASAPYPRRTPGQPKSSRQQFSACGACRMRRVRCDLKDIHPIATPNGVQRPSCSNCRERSIKCVDEFAEVKAVKLLRRGRRLQQVEAVYGKVTDDVSLASSVPQDSTTSSSFSPTNATPTQTRIPQMQLAFLSSPFFRIFCVQRPVIEPAEFSSRYIAHVKGTAPLNVEGKMLAMLLVTWAASFGIDEFGGEDHGPERASESPSGTHFAPDCDADLGDTQRRTRMLRTEAMTREILTLVDSHALLRRPSWDGVRVLLLLLPLTRGIQSPLERLTTYEATLSQVYSLCNAANPPSVNSGLGPYCDILLRARIFWYAHVHEGITTGLNGGRLLLDEQDLVSFQSTLPPQYCAAAALSTSESSHTSPTSSPPVSLNFPFNSPQDPLSHPRAALAYMVTTQYFSVALAVSSACRAIHSALTGPRARRRTESGIAPHEEAVVKIWDDLERCWDDFETLRRSTCGVNSAGGGLIRGEDVERFVSSWQVFIFECLNVIREALPSPTENGRAIPSSQVISVNLHLSAIQRCRNFLPRVVEILKRHLAVPSSFFAHDAGLIRDGCFFAGLLLARSDELDAGGDMVRVGWGVDWEDGVVACLQALGEVRWVYSRSHEREKILRAEWDARIERDACRQQVQRSQMSFPFKQSPGHSPCLNDNAPLPCSTGSNSNPRSLSLVSVGGQARPHLPPLSVSFAHDDSGPDTSLTDDGSGSWETYTPPPTSGSMACTGVTHRSLSPISPPHHPTMRPIHGVKNENSIFRDVQEMDQFSFAVEGTPDHQSSVGPGLRAQWSPFGHHPNNYLDPRVMLVTSDIVLGCEDGLGSAYYP